MKNANDEHRAVSEWLDRHPSPAEHRSFLAQAMWEFFAIIAWSFWGAVAVMVIGSPFMFLWFLVIFG